MIPTGAGEVSFAKEPCFNHVERALYLHSPYYMCIHIYVIYVYTHLLSLLRKSHLLRELFPRDICVYTYIYMCIHIYLCLYDRLSVSICVSICAYMCVYQCLYVRQPVPIYASICALAYSLSQVPVCLSICVYMCIDLCLYMCL